MKDKSEGCPITKKRFLEKARPLALQLGEIRKVVGVKEFTTGSIGWHINEKATILVDGVPLKVQCNIIMTVVGSKGLDS